MDKLVPSFQKSLFDGVKDVLCDLSELGIDSVLDEGVFKSLPLFGLLVGAKKTYQNLHDRNLLQQTIQFIVEFNSNTIDDEKLKKYQEAITNDIHKAEEELGRVLLYLNGNIELEKSRMLANLFRNYVMGILNWNEFCEYAEIVKMMLISDIGYLKKIYCGTLKDTEGYSLYPFNRLLSLGLIDTTPKGLYPINPDGPYVRYDKFVALSKIGGKFYQCIIQ